MYNVQTKTQRTIARQARLGLALLMIATIFVSCFYATQAIMTAVYGQGLEAEGSAYIGAGAGMPPTYADVIDKTTQAADQSQGYMIDSYIQNIKAEICPTLEIEAEYLECLNI